MKKNNFKLKDEIIILPNADKKEWHETWTKESHGYDVLVHPFKAILSGRPNVGKSNTIINVFLRAQLSARPFDTLIIVQPSTSHEYDGLDASLYLSDLPDDIEVLVNPEFKKTLIIIDDYDLTKLSKNKQKSLSMLFRYISSHCNISIILSYQSFFDIPPMIRKCSDYFFLWKTNNKDEINLISKRVGYDKIVFQNIFNNYITKKYDFLVVDQKSDQPLRKNLYEIIEI